LNRQLQVRCEDLTPGDRLAVEPSVVGVPVRSGGDGGTDLAVRSADSEVEEAARDRSGALKCDGVPAGLAGTRPLGSLTMELVAMGSCQHFGQIGGHERGPFGWSGRGQEPDQGRRLGPERLAAGDAVGAAVGVGDPSTSARQASMRAMIWSQREVLVAFTGHLRSVRAVRLDPEPSIEPLPDLTLTWR
jgi:hypothetical protein